MIHPWLPSSWRWRPYRRRSRCWRSSTHPDGRKCAALAIAGDQRRAQPGGLHDAQPLRQHGPRGGLVGGMETAWPQPGQPGLRAADHRVPAAHLRPATPVDVQRQNRPLARRLHQDHRRRPAPCVRYSRPGSPVLRRGASPLGTKHRVQLRPGRLACQRCGGEALPEPPARVQPAIACSSITDIRAVADGADINHQHRSGPGGRGPARRSPAWPPASPILATLPGELEESLLIGFDADWLDAELGCPPDEFEPGADV